MINLILTILLAAIVGGAGLYIYRSKKAGVKCIGCPQGCRITPDGAEETGCSGSCSGCSGGCPYSGAR